MVEIAEILALKSQGVAQNDIALALGTSPSTVSRMLAAYRKQNLPAGTGEVRAAVDELLTDSEVPEVMKAILRGLSQQFDALTNDGSPAAARALPAISEEMRDAVTNLLTWPTS